MSKTRIGTHDVETYDDIESLPVTRFHRYNKMLLVDAGIGSDIADFDRHMEKAARYLRAGDTENAARELDNMRQNVYMVIHGLSPRHLAFAALVKSIDGEARDDLSDEGLRETSALLGGASEGELAEALATAKKKIDTALRVYFPAEFEDAAAKEYHDLLKGRTAAVLRSVLGDTGAAGEIDRLTGELLMFSAPKAFGGKENAEIAYDKQFEDMCLLVGKELNAAPKLMTVTEFYCAVERLKEEARRSRKAIERMKKR